MGEMVEVQIDGVVARRFADGDYTQEDLVEMREACDTATTKYVIFPLVALATPNPTKGEE